MNPLDEVCKKFGITINVGGGFEIVFTRAQDNNDAIYKTKATTTAGTTIIKGPMKT